MKLVAPLPNQKTNVLLVLDAITNNLSSAKDLINALNIYEKRRLRALAAQKNIKSELLRLAYRE